MDPHFAAVSDLNVVEVGVRGPVANFRPPCIIPSMKRPAVFFDRDNTLIANDGYLGNPAGVILIDGAADVVAAVRNLGYVTVVFSNQSGVARGLFSEESVHAVNARLDEMLLDHHRGAVIDRHEFCPFHPDGSIERYRQDSPLRKPHPGMIFQASDALGLDLALSWVVGDAPRDIAAGRAAGCRTILIRNPLVLPSPAAVEAGAEQADFIVSSLGEAARTIAEHTAVDERPELASAVHSPQPAPPVPAPAPEPPQQQEPTVEPVSPPPVADAPKNAREAISNWVSRRPSHRAVPDDGAAAPAGEDAPAEDGGPAGKATSTAESEGTMMLTRASTARLEKIAHQILEEIRETVNSLVATFQSPNFSLASCKCSPSRPSSTPISITRMRPRSCS